MAETVQSDAFDDPQRPYNFPFGVTVDTEVATIATTSLDDINDRVQLIRVPARGEGRRIKYIAFANDDLDSGGPTLTAKLVLRYDSTDVELVASGTYFQAANTGRFFILDTEIPESVSGEASIDFVVTAAATTPAQGTLRILAAWQ